MEIDIINEVDIPIPKKCIEWFLGILLNRENVKENIELSVLFTDNKKIQKLNLEYRNIDKPTNVLSFSMREGFLVPFNNILGDIVISYEYAKDEAEAMKIDLKDRLIQLIVHGILHLLGYDHVRDEDYEKMKEKEDFYFGLWEKEREKCLKMRN